MSVKPGEFSPEVVQVIWERDRGCCAKCGRRLREYMRGQLGPIGGWSVQHREARGAGGVGRKGARPWLTRASNGVLLCGDGTTGCHGDVETRERAAARELGFVVSATGIRRPASVPILHALYGWVLLDDEGGYRAVDEHGEATRV